MHGQRVAAPGGSEGPKGVGGVQRGAMQGQRGGAPVCMKAATSKWALSLLMFTMQVGEQACNNSSKQYKLIDCLQEKMSFSPQNYHHDCTTLAS